MARFLSALVTGAAAATAIAIGADPNWPQFRGADSNPIGVDAKLPDKWSKTENVEWSVSVPGRGWSSPIVTGGKILLTAAVTDGESKKPQTGTEYSNEYAAELSKQGLSDKEIMARLMARDFELPHEVNLHYMLYCLDLKSGATLWKKEFHTGKPPGGRHRKNSFTSETPVTDGKSVYVYVANLGIWAFDLKGKQLWQTKLDANPIYLEFGTASSPVLNGNQLIVTSDNQTNQFVASFDKRTGKQLWRTARQLGKPGDMQQRSGWSTPYVWKNPVRTELVTLGPGAVISYDFEGKELWRINGASELTVPSPFAIDGMLYVNGGRGRPIFAIRPGATGDITLPKGEKSNAHIAWSEPRGGTYLPSPVYYDGAIYSLGETGILMRIDAKSGKVTYRSRLKVDAGDFTSSPWAYNGKLFCLSEEGKTYVVSTGETFELLHTNLLDELALSSPAIVGDRLLLRTESKLYSIRQK